jgi:hypothetical protein
MRMRREGQVRAVGVVALAMLTVTVAGCGTGEKARRDAEMAALVKQVDELIQGRFHRHPAAEVILSLPGMGVLLGAEFLAVTAGNMAAFGTPDRLASLAGVAPVPRDSGRVVGNLHRPQRYHRGGPAPVSRTLPICLGRCCRLPW